MIPSTVVIQTYPDRSFELILENAGRINRSAMIPGEGVIFQLIILMSTQENSTYRYEPLTLDLTALCTQELILDAEGSSIRGQCYNPWMLSLDMAVDCWLWTTMLCDGTSV